MRHLLVISLAIVLLMLGIRTAVTCPYCTVESATLAEDMASSDAVVIAKLIKPAPPAGAQSADGPLTGIVDPETGMAKFQVVKVLVGQDMMEGTDQIEAVFFGQPDADQLFLIRGVGTDRLDWNVPLAISEVASQYIQDELSLPAEGPERMRFFLDYLQHEDPLLAQDAYDEFARASYPDLLEISEGFDREKLWPWIIDPLTSANRRSLYFTMLGVVGTEEDQRRLEEMMLADNRVLRSAAEAAAAAAMGLGGALTLPVMPEMVSMEQRQKQLGFNAMVGCYLKLTGAKGLDLLDREFLSSDDDDPTKVYGLLLALRFLGDQTEDVSIDRLSQSMRLILAKPDFAEQAIRDLARWEDWDVLDQLVTMFKEVDEDAYVRDTIVAYLDQAAKQPGEVGEKATAALAELEPLDPKSFKRARSLTQFGFLGYARAGSRPADQAPPLNKPEAATDSTPTDDTAASTDATGTDTTVDTAPAGQPPIPVAMQDTTATSDNEPPVAETNTAETNTAETNTAETNTAETNTAEATPAEPTTVATTGPAAPEQPAAATTADPANSDAVAAMDEPEEPEEPAIKVPSPTTRVTTVLVIAGVLVVIVWGVMRGGA